MSTKKTATTNKKFERVKAVTLPTIKLEVDATYYITFDSEIRTEKTIEQTGPDKGKEKDIDIATVINAETGQQGNIVIGAVLKNEIERAYPEAGYVGKSFEITKKKVAGKRYNNFEVFEIKM